MRLGIREGNNEPANRWLCNKGGDQGKDNDAISRSVYWSPKRQQPEERIDEAGDGSLLRCNGARC